MPNPENVIKNKITSTSEARKRGSNGGIKSGEVRRQKKLLKEELEILLDLLDETGNTNQEAMCISLLLKAKAGDTKAFEIIRDTILQKPVDRVENTNINKTPFEIKLIG